MISWAQFVANLLAFFPYDCNCLGRDKEVNARAPKPPVATVIQEPDLWGMRRAGHIPHFIVSGDSDYDCDGESIWDDDLDNEYTFMFVPPERKD